MPLSAKLQITVGARQSPLSIAQFHEALEELRTHHPDVDFVPISIATFGDKDLKTSLRTLGKSDFFTREIDQAQLKGECRISIHSAKDLAEPLPEGLELIALTAGVDSSDSLVLRKGETIHSLKPGAIIATSSKRREHAVRELRSDLRFCDLRGTIGVRLAKLDTGEADGVVVGEAAIIRLKLTHLNRVTLPGDTNPFQGQLAILARTGDTEMQELFRCLDSRCVV